jgi:hypothetical protein
MGEQFKLFGVAWVGNSRFSSQWTERSELAEVRIEFAWQKGTLKKMIEEKARVWSASCLIHYTIWELVIGPLPLCNRVCVHMGKSDHDYSIACECTFPVHQSLVFSQSQFQRLTTMPAKWCTWGNTVCVWTLLLSAATGNRMEMPISANDLYGIESSCYRQGQHNAWHRCLVASSIG